MIDLRCGTAAGYKVHLRKKEEACRPCKDAESARTRARYAKNPERHKYLTKKWAENNKERRKSTNLTWYYKNKEHKQKLNKIWKEQNSEKVLESARRTSSRRRARVAENGTEPYTEKQVLETYGTKCHICNKPIDLTAPKFQGKDGWEKGLQIDHLIPISKGGSDTLVNVRPSHGLCNLRKHAKANLQSAVELSESPVLPLEFQEVLEEPEHGLQK